MKRTVLALIFLAAFLFPTAAHAQGGIIYGETIPAGTVVDHDVLLIGQNVFMDGVVNGNLFILGNQVLVSGTVNGSILMIAQNAAISGSVAGAVYAVALTLDLPATASLSRDLYSLSVSLTSQPASRIARHLFALGLDAGLSGKVGGDLHTVVGPIQLYNGLMRVLGFEELTLELHFQLPSPPPSGSAPDLATAPAPKVYLRLKLQNGPPPFDWSRWALDSARAWGVLFALGLLVYWLWRRPLEDVGAPLRAHPWRTLGVGILVLVISLNLFVVALLVVALIFAIGLGLNAIGLWQISIALWLLAYSALLILLTLLVLFIIYGTKILVAYHIFSWLAGRLSLPRSLWLDLGILLVGTLLYTLLRSLPYVGWAIGLLVIAAGMGSAWLAFRSPSSPEAQALPASAASANPAKPAKRVAAA